MCPTNFSDQVFRLPPVKADLGPSSGELPEADVEIVTSGGLRIPAHRCILASASPVLESIIDRPRKHRSSERTIPILGVPCDAVSVFIRFLYTPKCTEEEMGKYGIHLLALSHVFLVPQLKQRSTKAVGECLTIDNVIDVLQLARLCDAPDLHLKCMKFVSTNFKSVKKTEGWKFVQDHDPFLELQILQFIDETELRKKRTRRHREEQSLYLQLSEAMECLEHICTEGCMAVGPCDMDPTKNRGPCGKFATCQGLQLLIRHFAMCDRRMNGGGCCKCKRMWQLFRLHSSICDQPDVCRVPLCRQFKMKAQQEIKKGTREDAIRWRLLVRKVVSAKAISSLSMPKRKRVEEASTTTKWDKGLVEDINNEGINFDAYEDIPVETSGTDVPPAVNTFAEIDLGKALNDNIRRCRYVRPTPVQHHAIPVALAERDLMACAQTGSGKTAAFCFPIISGVMIYTSTN